MASPLQHLSTSTEQPDMQPPGVLFVCLGNICRSPSAQGVLEQQLRQRDWQSLLRVDSCGTADFHSGRPPDSRAVATAKRKGYDISAQRARQIEPADYHRYQYLLAMDRMNLLNLQAWAPRDFDGEIALLMNYDKRRGATQVDDPYYGGAEQFDRMFTILERVIPQFLAYLDDRHGLSRSKT